MTKNLQNEVKLGRTAGPFLSPPFPNFQMYPIGVVPKKYLSDWRTIFHLSHPKASGNSVNDYISKENYSLQYVKLDDAINLIIQLGRNTPVHPSEWELLGIHWQGLRFFDKVLPFGLRSAPYRSVPIAHKKTYPASTQLEFLGVLLNSEKMTACLPANKLTGTNQTLFEWLSKKSCILHELQSLIGTLQFACRVVVPGRAFLQRMTNLTAASQNHTII